MQHHSVTAVSAGSGGAARDEHASYLTSPHDGCMSVIPIYIGTSHAMTACTRRATRPRVCRFTLNRERVPSVGSLAALGASGNPHGCVPCSRKLPSQLDPNQINPLSSSHQSELGLLGTHPALSTKPLPTAGIFQACFQPQIEPPGFPFLALVDFFCLPNFIIFRLSSGLQPANFGPSPDSACLVGPRRVSQPAGPQNCCNVGP